MGEKIEQEQEQEKKIAAVRVSDDLLKAYLTLYKKEDEKHTLEEVLNFLKEKKVIYEIKTDVIQTMINENIFFKEILVAEGVPAKEGKDGYFEYFFDVDPPKKPITLEDGSIDYNTLGKIELRKEGDLLAEYHPAVPGEEGITVYDSPILPKRVVELKTLKGKGTVLSEDERQYFAARDGKVELKDGKLNVTELYVIEGDVDATTGDVTFNGDILVKGNVSANVKISAQGSITVNGHVEIATLLAGKDIILRNGVQGAGKGYIYSGGSVSAKFFEQTVVIAKGNINANTILNCAMESNQKIMVAGKQGVIVGGTLKAIEKIEASAIGNRAETTTSLFVGINIDFEKTMIEFENKIALLLEEEKSIVEKLGKVTAKLKKNSYDILQDSKNKLLRSKIELEARIKEEKKKKEELQDQKERSFGANIVVLQNLYPSTIICINGAKEVFKGACKNVTIKELNNEIHIYANDRFEMLY